MHSWTLTPAVSPFDLQDRKIDLPPPDIRSLVHRIRWPAVGTDASEPPEVLLRKEWLFTNGLGGYASGTVAGAITRRFHGLLVAALPAPHGRVMMLNHLSERLRLPDRTIVWLGAHGQGERLAQVDGTRNLIEFRLEAGLPVWRYQVGQWIIERSLLMPHGQNTVHVRYEVIEGDSSVRLTLRPLMHFRPHDAPVDVAMEAPYTTTAMEGRLEVSDGGSGLPPLRLHIEADGGAFTLDSHGFGDVGYADEQQRGYEHTGTLWSPGYFRADLSRNRPVTLVASVESWDVIQAVGPTGAIAAERARRTRLLALASPAARDGIAPELVLAADQFLITPAGRTEDAARARAVGDEVRTVIAGYHWFTDWGRDTMIALDGLTLVTGRHREAGYILRTFAQYVRHGLLPNLFPERDREGLYHTADATLWFFHALDRYLDVTDDRQTLTDLLPALRDIAARHLEGTLFNIAVDPEDGLLRQGAEGYQLTWMDAKVDDWVVTPRRGKAVEINALWYNALRLLEGWLRDSGDVPAAAEISRHADRVHEAFNERFWNPLAGYLYDVIDGEHGYDAACRPNQLLAISLAHPVLDRSRWGAVVNMVRQHLLTPVGLRSLARDHADYKAKYFGDLRARDAAYHQGTVWAWLIGPFVDAWLAVHPGDRAGARAFLQGFVHHLDDACIGSISEIFDAEEPFTPRGCIAQAWSVAEVLRAWARTTE